MPLDNQEEYQNHIPAAVRRASERADELVRQQQEQVEDQSPGGLGDETVEGTAGLPASAEPAPGGGEGISQPLDPSREPAPPQEIQPQENWQERYWELQRRVDADLRQLHGENASLRQILGNLQAQNVAPQSAPSNTTTAVIPDDDATEYGEDLIQASRRWARAEVQEELGNLRRQVEQLAGGQRQIESNSTLQRVFSGIAADPEIGHSWEQINADPRFIAWLSEPDPYSALRRQEMLNHAVAHGDVPRVARFFKAWLAETGQAPQGLTPPTRSSAAGGTSGSTAARPSVDLASLAAPGRPRGGSSTGAGGSNGRIWQGADIAKFYSDSAKGRFRGREDEQRRIEQDIFQAEKEGRIVRA